MALAGTTITGIVILSFGALTILLMGIYWRVQHASLATQLRDEEKARSEEAMLVKGSEADAQSSMENLSLIGHPPPRRQRSLDGSSTLTGETLVPTVSSAHSRPASPGPSPRYIPSRLHTPPLSCLGPPGQASPRIPSVPSVVYVDPYIDPYVAESRRSTPGPMASVQYTMEYNPSSASSLSEYSMTSASLHGHRLLAPIPSFPRASLLSMHLENTTDEESVVTCEVHAAEITGQLEDMQSSADQRKVGDLLKARAGETEGLQRPGSMTCSVSTHT